MAETKTKQKNWRFTPQILKELDDLCNLNLRSQQNMIEVLIHQEHDRFYDRDLMKLSGIADVEK